LDVTQIAADDGGVLLQGDETLAQIVRCLVEEGTKLAKLLAQFLVLSDLCAALVAGKRVAGHCQEALGLNQCTVQGLQFTGEGRVFGVEVVLWVGVV
jgi:hypothetical protein